MLVRKLRLKNGWSQEQLAEMSGLSVRTIQRVERGQNPELETLKSLAAVFEIDFNELKPEAPMHTQPKSSDNSLSQEEERAIRQVRDIKGFYVHLICYLIIMLVLFGINVVYLPGYLWFWWTGMGWGLGVLSHGLAVYEVFNLFSPDWEKRQVERRLRRKL